MQYNTIQHNERFYLLSPSSSRSIRIINKNHVTCKIQAGIKWWFDKFIRIIGDAKHSIANSMFIFDSLTRFSIFFSRFICLIVESLRRKKKSRNKFCCHRKLWYEQIFCSLKRKKKVRNEIFFIHRSFHFILQKAVVHLSVNWNIVRIFVTWRYYSQWVGCCCCCRRRFIFDFSVYEKSMWTRSLAYAHARSPALIDRSPIAWLFS